LRGDQDPQIANHIEQCPECQRDARATVNITDRAAPRTLFLWPKLGSQAVEADAQIGQVVAGKYRLERVIGAGGMGVVMAATHLGLGHLVALKFMNPAMLARSDAVSRFWQEARAAVRLRGQHVGHVLDIGTLDSGEPYIVMEYLEGEDLGTLLDRGQRFDTATAVELVLQTCTAVAEAHDAGIVHRDLKPANLFLTRCADGSRFVKVLDFGISKWEAQPAQLAITESQSLWGSPAYMAPEQMLSPRDVDRRSDIWSLGVILYQLLTGQLPFAGETLPALLLDVMGSPPKPMSMHGAAVPVPLEQIALRCLSRDPAHRPSTIRDLVALLVAARDAARAPAPRTPTQLQATPVAVAAPQPVALRPPPARRRWIVITLATFAAVLVGLGASVLLARFVPSGRSRPPGAPNPSRPAGAAPAAPAQPPPSAVPGSASERSAIEEPPAVEPPRPSVEQERPSAQPSRSTERRRSARGRSKRSPRPSDVREPPAPSVLGDDDIIAP
jgi:serine/threonine-protein kinase